MGKINVILHNEFDQRQQSKAVVSEGEGLCGASQLWGAPEGLGSIPAHGVGALLWALVSSMDPTKNYNVLPEEGLTLLFN